MMPNTPQPEAYALRTRIAGRVILSLLSLIILFHLTIITGLVPYDIVWGGRLETQSQMLVFEMVSIGINFFILWLVAMKMKIVKPVLSPKTLRVLFWLLFGLFSLNTLGNLMAENHLEMIIFTPLTLLLAVFFFQLARAPLHP